MLLFPLLLEFPVPRNHVDNTNNGLNPLCKIHLHQNQAPGLKSPNCNYIYSFDQFSYEKKNIERSHSYSIATNLMSCRNEKYKKLSLQGNCFLMNLKERRKPKVNEINNTVPIEPTRRLMIQILLRKVF